MKCSNPHFHPEHVHGPDCGHTAIRHNGHIDYIHDGHLHHSHDDHCDEHVIEISEKTLTYVHRWMHVMAIYMARIAGTSLYRMGITKIT